MWHLCNAHTHEQRCSILSHLKSALDTSPELSCDLSFPSALAEHLRHRTISDPVSLFAEWKLQRGTSETVIAAGTLQSSKVTNAHFLPPTPWTYLGEQ